MTLIARFGVVLTTLVLMQFALPAMVEAAASDRVERERKRLEELFIWKMSEELKLSVDTEVAFAEALRSLNREKSVALNELNAALLALGDATQVAKGASSPRIVKAMDRYEKAVRRYGEFPFREVARLKPILGAEVTARYLFAKSQVTEKLLAISTSGGDLKDSGAPHGPADGQPESSKQPLRK